MTYFLLGLLLGAYSGVTAFATYAQVVTEDEPLWASLWLAASWPMTVYREYRNYRAYRTHPTGDV